MPKYIDPLSDFGFKRIFANPQHPEVTRKFLNALLELEKPIAEVQLQNQENTAENLETRGVIFDIFCRDIDGREFIVELQRVSQKYFVDRSLFYVCRKLSSQIKKGSTSFDKYKLTPIYWLGITNFDIFNDENYIHKINLRDDKCQNMNENLNFVYVELRKFKNENPQTLKDLILYFMKHEGEIDLKNTDYEFNQILELAKYYNLSTEEQNVYDIAFNKAWATFDAVETAKKTGIEQGKKSEKLEIAKSLLKNNVDLSIIELSTGLSQEEILSLKDL